MIFKGPLGSHRGYLQFIALENCLDYFHLREEHKELEELSKIRTPHKFKEIRLFLSAVESLNNVPDYYFHENGGEDRFGNQGAFRGALRSRHPEIAAIAKVANAYKHCVIDPKEKTQAKDLQSPTLSAEINLKDQSVSVSFSIDLTEEAVLNDALKFWLGYIDGGVVYWT